jgi:hypothetical protein
MITTLAELQQTHPEYERYIREWKFLSDAYNGGSAWESGGYLTRYVFESDEEYQDRIAQTPYDNQCGSIVNLFNSFLFATSPNRELAGLESNPSFVDFLEDSDMEGRSFDQFMRQVDIVSAVYGHAWVIVDKSDLQLITAADEQAIGLRPYVSLFTPMTVLDWNYARLVNGTYVLDYLKVIESQTTTEMIIKVFETDTITTYRGKKGTKGVEVISQVPNALGRVPATVCYNQRSDTRGVGISAIADVARINRSIYDEHSELVQIIRLSNHPSLVKTGGTLASAGAGAIIQMEDNLDPGLKPFLLQPDSASLDGVRNSIKDKIESINRLAAVNSVRATELKTQSGIALETEMRTLNAKLAQKGDQLELCEEHIIELWCQWQNLTWAGVIEYPDSFNARDRKNDLTVLEQAQAMTMNSVELQREIHRQIASIVVHDPEKLSMILESLDQPEQTAMTEPGSDTVTRVYPDGQPVPAALPPAYQSSATDGVPEGQACGNCEYNQNQQCTLFANSPIRESWWCLKWEANDIETSGPDA